MVPSRVDKLFHGFIGFSGVDSLAIFYNRSDFPPVSVLDMASFYSPPVLALVLKSLLLWLLSKGANWAFARYFERRYRGFLATFNLAPGLYARILMMTAKGLVTVVFLSQTQVWDVYDGHRPVDELSAEQKETAVKEPPNIMETFAFSLFFGSFLVGPQLPLTRFRAWVKGDFADPKTGGPPDTYLEAGKRLAAGVSFLAIHLVLTPSFPDEQFYGDHWLGSGLFWKHVLVVCWYRIKLLKYQSAWLITEGVCIQVGLSHNGVDEAGKVQWDGLRNIRLWIFETGCSFNSIIASFNLNTNKWAAKYVFKRLKFLGNKNASQGLTLGFLAWWHGWHLGYFTCFVGEFLTVNGEKELVAVVKKVPQLDSLLRGKLWPLTWLVCKVIMLFGSSFFFISFGLIKKEKWFPVYNALYWDGFVCFMLLWPAVHYGLRLLLKKNRPREEKKTE